MPTKNTRPGNTSPENRPTRPAGSDCQLYLVVEALPGEATAARLKAALNAAPIASVLITPPTRKDDGSNVEPVIEGAKYADLLRPLIAMVQDSGAAMLLLDDISLVKSLKADGLHISQGDDTLERLEAARGALLTNFIIGATGGPLRDDAMALGDKGADYVGFALPASELKSDASIAIGVRLKLASWWADIIEVPGVAFDVGSTTEAQDLAAAGVDFVAVYLPSDASPADIAEHVRAYSAALAKPQAA